MANHPLQPGLYEALLTGALDKRLADLVVAAGIKAFLNFSAGTLVIPEGVKLKSVDLTVSLESLSFYLAQGIDDES